MIEAFRNAPRVGVGPPGARQFGQPTDERARVSLYGVEAVLQHADVAWMALPHALLSCPLHTLGY
jgi:hypothetical protein